MPTRLNAFSLLELVLVLVLISIALAVVTPSLGGWSRGMRLRTAIDDTFAATRFARDQAVVTAVAHRLDLFPADGDLIVRPVEDALLPDHAAGERTFTLPLDVSVAAFDATGSPLESITFHPDGRMDRAVLRLTTPQGDFAELINDTPAAGFRLVDTGGDR